MCCIVVFVVHLFMTHEAKEKSCQSLCFTLPRQTFHQNILLDLFFLSTFFRSFFLSLFYVYKLSVVLIRLNVFNPMGLFVWLILYHVKAFLFKFYDDIYPSALLRRLHISQYQWVLLKYLQLSTMLPIRHWNCWPHLSTGTSLLLMHKNCPT